ncbi:MAG: veratrol--corrinoid protein metyltransferase [Eubacteriaceae bacterium]|nr:veratrol--corrinoid protein metyltransferase [Eubacteriaceae bacterium]
MPLTERENYLKVIHGETPEWVPRYYAGVDPHSTKPPAAAGLMVSPFPRLYDAETKISTDIFGVRYIATAETGWMSLPIPNEFHLDDVRNWRDVVKLPDLSNIDWDTLCKKAVDALPGGPEAVAVTYGGIGNGFFMPLMNLMGFTNGLIAMYEEPEIVEEMYDYMATWYKEGVDKTLDKLPVDVFTVGDDTASAYQPFISPACYRSLIKPALMKVLEKVNERGLPVMMHDCGRCEDFIEDWRDFGVTSWNPAQRTNDLDGIKAKYGNSLVLIGCWDSSGPAGYMYASEEVVREAVRETIDRFGPNGGFMFWGSVYGPEDDPAVDLKRKWMTDEYEKYRETPYK